MDIYICTGHWATCWEDEGGKKRYWVSVGIQQLIRSKLLAVMKSKNCNNLTVGWDVDAHNCKKAKRASMKWQTGIPWASWERKSQSSLEFQLCDLYPGILSVYLNGVWAKVIKESCSQEVLAVSWKHGAFEACQALRRGTRGWGMCIRKKNTGSQDVYILTQKKTSKQTNVCVSNS